MSVIFKPKRSSTPGAIPLLTDLADGEIAINSADGIIYQRIGTDILPVADYGGGGGSSPAHAIDATEYGAFGDGKIAFLATMASGDPTLTLLNATGVPQDLFSADDVGKEIVVAWAGSGSANHYTTIASYTSPTSVELTAAPPNSTQGYSTCAWWPVGRDDTAAINDAIEATSNGGPTDVLLPSGVYVYRSTNASVGAIDNIDAPMLTGIYGGGGRRTWLVNGAASSISKAISLTDPNIGFRLSKLSVFGPGMAAPAGGDIEFKLNNQSNCDQMVLENVSVIHSAGYGLNIPVPILVEVKNCKMLWTARDGAYYRDGTSIHFNGTYCLAAGFAGFHGQNMAYSAHTGCAVEGAGIGYYAENCTSMTYTGCGGEELNDRSYNGSLYNGSMFVFDGGNGGHVIVGGFSRDLPLNGSRHIKTVNGADDVTVVGYRALNIAVTPAYDFEVGSGSENVSFINCTPASTRLLDNGTNTSYRKGRTEYLGTASSGSTPYETKSANFTAVAYGRYEIDTNGVQAQLPATPTDGHWVEFVFATDTITGVVITRNGEKIMGLSEDMSVDNTRIGFRLVYTGTTNGWRLA